MQHSIFWLAYFLINTFRWGIYFDDYWYSFKSNLVEFPIHLVLVYCNLYFLLPRYIPSRWVKYIAYLFLATLIMSLVRIIFTYELVTTVIWRESYKPAESIFGFNYILAVFIGELYVIGIATTVKLIVDWVRAQKRTIELERRNHETELSFLRSQVQPHFFFNTLNNLYSLTLDKSDKAPETVLKLSELMSYVIYKGRNKTVRLTDEVKHIQNYIDLERLRYGDKLKVAFSITGEIQNKFLPPLILMPFIENSFKHGIHYRRGKIPIAIDIEVSENSLHFRTFNPKGTSKKNNFDRKEASGIGIQNTRRRLELLYGNNFQQEVKENDDSYALSLKIMLYES